MSRRRSLVFAVVAAVMAVTALVVLRAGVSSAGSDAPAAVDAANSGIVAGWGINYLGGLGPARDTSYPGQVPGLPGPAVQVVATDQVSAAVLLDGSVWTWGDSRNCGLLGNGNPNELRPMPGPVQQLPSTIVQVAVGPGHVLALSSDGSVYSWGCNGPYGVLGTGVAEGERYVPARVTLPGVSNVAEVAAGGEFSMVLLKTGEVLTWGRNLYGQLGNGSTVNSLTPVRAAAPYGIAHIAAKLQSAIAVRSLALGGAVFTWGDNTFGQLGQRTSAPFSATPKREAARINGVTQIATSGDTDLVLTSSGTVWGWGSNHGGKLTRPDTANQPAPVQLTALNGASQVTVGVLNGAAIRTDGTVWAWGNNGVGQLGDGTRNDTSFITPVLVSRVHGATNASFGTFYILVVAASVDPPPTP